MAKQWNQLERLDHKALKKLQAEREKAAKLEAAALERKKNIIMGAVVLFIIILVGVFIHGLRVKAKNKAFQEEREKLTYSSVTEHDGTVEYRISGDWESLFKDIKFNEPYSFRTSEESFLTVLMQLDNQAKLYGETEVTVNPPEFENATTNKVKKEVIELIRGEITAIVSLEGRGVMSIETSSIRIVGQSGLFKVKYNDEEGTGEVVVKNGLVEVSKKDGSSKPVKITGFYKVTFDGDEISNPSQASIIQYDWR